MQPVDDADVQQCGPDNTRLFESRIALTLGQM